jgi:NAD(P)-dependent dehydrogenase (short-subunit alcohol dehydrogenase family)
MFDLTGKVALVTGGNSGLGFAFANGLARAGANLIIWGRRAESNREAVERLLVHGGRVESRAVDVTDAAAVADAMAAAVESFGGLDCVIANAGTATMVPIDEMGNEAWHGLLDVNLHGVFYTCREAARQMKRLGRGGSIVINASLATFAGAPGLAHYAAAKGGINSMSKTMAVELGRDAIRVNVVCPGLIITGIASDDEATKASVAAATARTPLGRLGTPDELEGIAVYLASDASRYHTGDTITLDGGMMAQLF